IDSRGELWAASIAGVSHYRNGEIINFYSENGLPIENIRFVSEDNEGNIWMGTDGKGVLKFAGESFVAFTTNDGLSSEQIMSVLQDSHGDFWFGTYGKGLIRYNGEEYTQYTDANGLSNNIVWTSCETPDHKLWFGTSDGLCVFDGKKFEVVSDTSAYVSNKITSLLALPDGSVWIGRRTGASLMKPDGNVLHYDARHGLHGGNVRCMITDEKGILWLGGASGLYSFDGKKFKLYKPNPQVEDNTVYCIVRFPNGRIWVGTNSGLFAMENEKFTKLFLSENPNANNVNFLLPDGKELWVGTNSGIFEVFPADKANLDELTVVAYTKYEGVRGTETNLNACYRDRKGRLWFGTDAGLLRYDRSLEMGAAMFPPFMHINDVRIFFDKPDWKKYSKNINALSGLPTNARVPYNRNHFTFYFTGISHSNPSRLRYVFKLDGFDDKWSPPTNADFATYTYLPDGNYTFRVKCLNRDGVWSREATFPFIIIPPFWRTWWFFVTMISVCALVIILVWRWRIAVLKRKNKTLQLYYHSKLLSLEQQSLNASMNRHFIFNSLNSIQYYINKQDRLEANRYLTNFAKLIRKNLDSSVNGENMVSLQEELERIKLYLSLEMMRFKDKFTYELTVAPEIDLEALKIPPMLLQPYIENSIWHGILPKEKPGQLDLRIYHAPGSRDKICIEIMDDGIGIDISLAKKVNSGSTHISRGIEITSGRLNLLKKMTSQDLEIHGPEQVEGPNGAILGTRVLLIISTKALVKKELKNTNFSEKSFEF
ncbi:MAG: two-component regulator propeller domain-containing protein, partial [Flavobacteriales bacterium]